MSCIMGLIMGCVVGTNLFNSDWRQCNDGTEINLIVIFAEKMQNKSIKLDLNIFN